MRILLTIALITLAASSASARVILNSFDENGSAKARAAVREEAIAKGEEVPLEAHEYKPPQNAFSAGWAATHARLKQAFTGTEQALQQNKVDNAKKGLARALRRDDADAIAAAQAKLATEEAKLAEISTITANHRTSATEYWGNAKDFTQSAMRGDGKPHPIAGFENDDDY